MHNIQHLYIDGAFVIPHGEQAMDIINPATEQLIGHLRLADEQDVQRAVAAARKAFPAFSRTSKQERIAMLQRLSAAVLARSDELAQVLVEEYGASLTQAQWRVSFAAQCFLDVVTTLENYEFTRQINAAQVTMVPLGVVAVITPWNSTYNSMCVKLGAAIAAGCTIVMKPSELSAIQARLIAECFHDAQLPPGVLNIVNGLGEVVGDAMSKHPDIAQISFTGSTAVGKTILRAGADTMKRVALELGGKSPTLILEDADLPQAVEHALAVGLGNNGQACIAGTRILVPESRLAEICELMRVAVAKIKVGDPLDPQTVMGPLVNRKQFERVQRYIQSGIDQGATLVAGGLGRPLGLESGYFVQPTVFANVTADMAIAQDEIFGPLLSILTYRTEEEAIAMANDSIYGLHAYVMSRDTEHARVVASQLLAGRVSINGFNHEPQAPFGGFKQSGLGRGLGTYGLEAHLEPRVVLGR